MPKKTEIRADAIEVTVSGGIKTEHLFTAADGILGVLTLNGMRAEGRFQGADNMELFFKKTSFWKSEYEIRDGKGLLGTARSRKVFSRVLDLEQEGKDLALVPGGSKFRSWKLEDENGSVICEIRPRAAFKRGAWIRIFTETTLSSLVFAYCLVAKRWQDENAAAAG